MPTTADDLLAAIDPHWREVTSVLQARGGRPRTVVAQHDQANA